MQPPELKAENLYNKRLHYEKPCDSAASLCAFAFAQPEPTSIAIRNAKIVTVSGPDIAKGTVVVRNGLIEAVGDNVAVPPDACVVEGEGLTVYPGLIDALSTWGLGAAAAAGAGAAGGGGRGGNRGYTDGCSNSCSCRRRADPKIARRPPAGS